MIIACPACATRYEVPDSAIRAEGRTVRCAKCRHSWFQDAAEPDAGEPPTAEPPTGNPGTLEHELAGEHEAVGAPLDDADGVDPDETGEPAFEQMAEPEPVEPSEAEPAFVAEEGDGAGEEIAEPPRRGRFRLWAWAALIFLALAGLTVAAASWWGLPGWAPFERPAFAASHPGLELDFPAERQERRQLPNGTEFFGASGTITNADNRARSVPPILIVLRDQRDRIVYSWEVAPPKRQLAPGESVTVNEAITDVPRSARVAEIGWKPV